MFTANLRQRIRRIGIIDLKLLQLAAVCVGLVIVKLVPQIMTLNIGWFIALAVVFGIRPVWVILR